MKSIAKFGFIFIKMKFRIKMFLYTIPNLVLAFSIFLYTIGETINGYSSNIDIIRNSALFVIFLLIAKRYYKNRPNTIGEKAFIISFNLAIIPILIADIYVVIDILNGGGFGKSMMAYMLPFIYTPIIFLLSFIIIFMWLKWRSGDSNSA